MGFFRWLLSAFGMSKREPWSLTVGPYQVGIIIWDGAVLDIFSEGTQTLPEGDVQTYVVTTAPVKFTYMIKGPGKSSYQNDIVLDTPPLTSDGQHATGRIDLTVSVMAQGSRFTSVIPEKADRLLQLLGLTGDVVTKSDIARVIKVDLSPRLLALDLRGSSADELRNNQGPVRDISNLLRTELASAIDRFGLQLDDFYVNWVPQHPQMVSSTKRSARDSRPEHPKTRTGRRSSPTRRQPVRKRKTIKTVMQQLDESGLFNSSVKQESRHHKVSFQVKGRRGANVFVTHDESEFLIKKRALKDDKFPDSETLYDFLLSHAHGTVRGKAKISAEHIEAFIDLIRSGLQENPKSRQAIRSSPTRRKRSKIKSTLGMTVLEKFKEAFPDQYEEKKRDHTIKLKSKATVYFRKTVAGPNEGRISTKWVHNFPNARKLEPYLKRSKVPIDSSESHPDYKIGSEHADRVIAILKEDG